MPETRIEFLWVRWLDRDDYLVTGPSTRRLERLSLVPLDQPNAVSFIDPADVIHGCHFIPAFHHGLAQSAGYPSIASDSAGASQYYYVNRCSHNHNSLTYSNTPVIRFVDRDMFARYIGMSVGSLDLQTHTHESMEEDGNLLHELNSPSAMPSDNMTLVSQDEMVYETDSESTTSDSDLDIMDSCPDLDEEIGFDVCTAPHSSTSSYSPSEFGM
jgi:hypothetical protein